VGRVLDRTGGNPLFVEEVVQALVETGSLVGASGAYRLVRPVDEVAIPATVQAVLAAPIDRPSPREEAGAQTPAGRGRRVAGARCRTRCSAASSRCPSPS